ARYVHPRYTWWAELVAIGLPYLAFAVVVGAAGAVALRAWRLAAAYALVLVLAVVRFGVPHPFGDGGGAPRPGDLRVMTYNVPRWGSPAEAAKTSRLRALIDSLEPGLLALQEALVNFDGKGALTDGTRPYVRTLTEPPLGYEVAYSSGQRRTAQPVLGRVSLFDLSQQTLRAGRPADMKDVTYVARAGFEWKGRRAVLYNVHLRSFGSDKPWRADNPHLFDWGFWKPYLHQYRNAYRARAKEIERIRKMLRQEKRPVIVAGDFNSTPHSWVYRQLTAGGMQDAFGRTGDGWGSTYHSDLPFARIDFVFASAEWKIVEARVPEADLSDHRPMLATLRWRSREGGKGKRQEGG
ncbi:MAG: hypothetical protein BRD37_07785, partial [Bacteroidetes bacterium QH_8_67_23]